MPAARRPRQHSAGRPDSAAAAGASAEAETGEEPEVEVRRSARMALWLSIGYGVLALPAMWYSEPILLAVGQAPVVAELAQEYLRIAGFGLVAVLCQLTLASYLAAMERTGAYQGRYYVLMGRLSPLDGVGPRDLGLPELLARTVDDGVQEVILATSFTAEGEATAHAISEALKSRGVHVTRLARGVPVGSELEYVDLGTIAHALVDRR